MRSNPRCLTGVLCLQSEGEKVVQVYEPTGWCWLLQTMSWVMRYVSRVSRHSFANMSSSAVLGFGVITSPAVSERNSSPCWTRRRRSPSVKMPVSRPALSTTALTPYRFEVISRIISDMESLSRTMGTASPVAMISLSLIVSLRQAPLWGG